jgi:molecular chaperone DnaJ
LRLPKAGEAGRNGGPPGDLYIFISLKRHDFFTRLGNDLFCEIPISPTQAQKGGEIEVPTLRGKVKIKIPPGTRTGKVFTLKGEGMPTLGRKGRGDQKIKIYVTTPL